MESKEFKEVLLTDLTARLSPLGFQRRQQTFIRYVGSATHTVHINFWSKKGIPTICALVSLGIGLQDVETIANSWRAQLDKKDDLYLSPKQIRDQTPMGGNLKEITTYPQHSWTLHNEDDVIAAAAEINAAIQNYGLRFFDTFSDLIAIRNALSHTNFREWHMLRAARAFRLPIVHALLGETAEAMEAFNDQYQALIAAKEPMAKHYPRFVAAACQLLHLSNPLERTIT